MKFGLKKGQKPKALIKLGSTAVAPSSIFPKVTPVDDTSLQTPVYLNVYDLTPMNGYMFWAGLGIFHSGVEVHGVEYAFGAHNIPASGVFEVEPRQCPGFKFKKSIFIGNTNMNPNQSRKFMEHYSENYHGNTYNLIVKNCNHFCNDVCYRLTGKSIPKWVNRLAKLGSSLNCVLPKSLKNPTLMQQESGDEEAWGLQKEEGLKGSHLSCFSSIYTTRRKPLLTPTTLLSWEMEKRENSSLKER
ncbi:deSI-like protein At4g17486 [Impatiens glandulifera]|uniref:deSI-like protein At4g17486 n=1 Tax=Impatiens glandulifera TaxID=253017 RepID=UPI001FB06F8A|nr:deSI-like protein At4g17486 [Impatiens glandulifera]